MTGRRRSSIRVAAGRGRPALLPSGHALAAQPALWVIATAKTITAASVGLVLGTVGMAAGFLGAMLGGIETGEASPVIACSTSGPTSTVPKR